MLIFPTIRNQDLIFARVSNTYFKDCSEFLLKRAETYYDDEYFQKISDGLQETNKEGETGKNFLLNLK